MGDFDMFGEDGRRSNRALKSTARGLKESSTLNRESLERMARTIDEQERIAGVADAMSEALEENNERMRRFTDMIEESVSRVETAQEDIYGRVEIEAAKTMKRVNEVCERSRSEIIKTNDDAIKSLAAAQKSFLLTVIGVSAAIGLILVLLVLAVCFIGAGEVAKGADSFLGQWGWLFMIVYTAVVMAVTSFFTYRWLEH